LKRSPKRFEHNGGIRNCKTNDNFVKSKIFGTIIFTLLAELNNFCGQVAADLYIKDVFKIRLRTFTAFKKVFLSLAVLNTIQKK